MMSLEEAIKHCDEVAEEQEKKACSLYENESYEESKGCIWCASEHRQIAEWLRELKMWRAYGRRNKDKLPEDMQLLKALNEEVNVDE